ncbi:MAG: hypothetical protein ABI702_07975 [Burkholderiales bacterium]
MNDEGPPIRAAHVPASTANTDAERVADAAVARWREIDAALSPIIGLRGVAALFRRSVHVQQSAHPWLAGARVDADQVGDFAGLRAAFRGQLPQAASAANGALHQTFVDLLSGLIGPSLTERLIDPQFDLHANGPAVQDTSS